MDSEKPKFNWQRMLITAGIVVFSALVVGGTTWYVMDKSAKEIKTANDSSVVSLQKQIDELKTAAKTLSAKKETTTPEAATSVTTSDLDSLRTFCIAGNSDTIITNLVYDSNQDGIYGGCGIGSKKSAGGGVFLIAQKINGTWTKIWVGNNSVDKALVTQYKIPVYIYPHQLLDN